MKAKNWFKILIVIMLVATAAMAKDRYRCAGDPKECAIQIRTFLTGKRYLGVKIEEEKSGLMVTRVVAESPAERAGMRVGDRVITVNGKDTTRSTVKVFKELVNSTPEGEKVGFVVARNGYFIKLQARFQVLNESQMKQVIETHLREAHWDDSATQPPEKQNAREKKK